MSKARAVKGSEFDKVVNQSDRPVVVDFYASWCGPCRVLGPTVDEIAGSFEGRADVLKVNIDDEPELAARFNVMSIPTLVFLRNGREVKRVTGAIPKGAFVSTLEGIVSGETQAA